MDANVPAKRPARRRSPSSTVASKPEQLTIPPTAAHKHETAFKGFAWLSQELATDRRRAMEAIRAGFPASLLKDAGAYFDLPVHRIRAIVRLPETTAHALLKRGGKLDTAASERLWRLADLMAMARDVFEDEAAAKTWLRSPNRTFGNAAPMDYLDTEPGAMAVRQVLTAIATGGAA